MLELEPHHRYRKIGHHRRLARRHKLIIHGTLLAVVTCSLIFEGGGFTDWAFLVLGVVVEIT